HALDLGGLVGSPKPAPDPHVGATARAAAWPDSGKVAKGEPDPGTMRIKRGDDNLPDFAVRNRIARPGPHHFDDDAFVDDHALACWRLVGDKAQVGGAVVLVCVATTGLYLVLHGGGKAGQAPQRRVERCRQPFWLRGQRDEHLDKVGLALEISRLRDFNNFIYTNGVARPRRDHCATEGPSRGIENEATRRQ